jgi:hypothetical protein
VVIDIAAKQGLVYYSTFLLIFFSREARSLIEIIEAYF